MCDVCDDVGETQETATVVCGTCLENPGDIVLVCTRHLRGQTAAHVAPVALLISDPAQKEALTVEQKIALALRVVHRGTDAADGWLLPKRAEVRSGQGAAAGAAVPVGDAVGVTAECVGSVVDTAGSDAPTESPEGPYGVPDDVPMGVIANP